jgi:hypothetical protein
MAPNSPVGQEAVKEGFMETSFGIAMAPSRNRGAGQP